jgi:hypothetical protein
VLAREVQGLIRENSVLTETELSSLTPAQRGLVDTARQNAAALQGLTRQALANTSERFAAIQQLIEWTEWTSQAGNPAAYAIHLRAQPLSGVPAKSVILQYARTDATVPNPTTSAIIRAGGLQDRTTLFRNDLAFAANPAVNKNPHSFLTNIAGPGAPYALAAQQQIATFLASDGTITIDPDGAERFFETPTSILPEDLAFIP